MSGFPVNLDLSEYFDDLRKYSSVFVNLSKCKDVGDVENHIKSVFSLEDDICLVYKKFLIPRSEVIQILQQYEIFKVHKCNFFDLPIQKSKRGNVNSTCEQKALNLIQSEKTIDLSCRPKQRLKISICPGSSRTLTHNVNNKSCTDSEMFSSVRDVSVNGNQNVSREKQKHKKKRQFQSDEPDNGGAEENILDMSVNNSKRNQHSNCFSTDDGSLYSKNVNDNESKGTMADLHKKHKRRKKQSEVLDDDSVDIAVNIFNDETRIIDQNTKKKSKKIREDNVNGGLSSDDNEAAVKNWSNNCSGDDYPCRKKSKLSKNNFESEEFSQENQYYSSTPFRSSKHGSKTTSSSSKKGHSHNEHFNTSSTLEEQKKIIQVEIDQIISAVHKDDNSDKTKQVDKSDEESVASNENLGTDVNPQHDEGNRTAENITHEPYSESDCGKLRRKRKRKHNKKKKKEKLMYMLAVGPALNQLADKSNNCINNTTAKSTQSSENAKHVFFTDDDFVDYTNISAPPPMKLQTIEDQSSLLDNGAEVALCQDQLPPKPLTWQDQLLKLASTSSKPVVFHRNTTVGMTSKSQISPQLIEEHSKPLLNTNNVVPVCKKSEKDIGERKSIHNVDEQRIESNLTAEDFRSCNGEVKTEEKSSCAQTVDGPSARRATTDNRKPLPLPNDFQNINLTDYPIIDKVVPDDLILFKVLRLNENNEPGFSKPILARVNGSSSFPDKISLQIMEGCEECSHCSRIEEDSEVFAIELRWSDILEPRLFYP